MDTASIQSLPVTVWLPMETVRGSSGEVLRMDPFESASLWRRTLAPQANDQDTSRSRLRAALHGFRERTALLASEIGAQLPHLTVHDLTHLDALWRVASEIAGPEYPLNPAEAFVLGGAMLLHDAAHTVVAYEGGVDAIKRSMAWTDLVGQHCNGAEPDVGSQLERTLLFDVLRRLHAERARSLPFMHWDDSATGVRRYLLEDVELREYFGDTIGQIAESHHWEPHKLLQEFKDRHITPPAYLAQAHWSVDVLKVAFMLRVADAAHIDALRAPSFLGALRRPGGVSQIHWHFQSKMGQSVTTKDGELRICSGSPFLLADRDAWWLAYETAKMIDRELQAAARFLRESGRPLFAAQRVEHISSPETFARNVKALGWEPIDVAPHVGDVPALVKSLGGARLYGEHPELALRELIQNALDAVRALRHLGGLRPSEGLVSLSLSRDSAGREWLHIVDSGIGMSRYVLTEVLLDFGKSLWRSERMVSELPGLASAGFRPVGRFGIGFFSIFMLGDRVSIVTRRFSRHSDESSEHWALEFGSGLEHRPTLRVPGPDEQLGRAGTRVSVQLSESATALLNNAKLDETFGDRSIWRHLRLGRPVSGSCPGSADPKAIQVLVAALCPSSDVEIEFRADGDEFRRLVAPSDWETMPAGDLLSRVVHSTWWSSSRSEGLLLEDVRDDHGVLLGRLAYAGGSSMAAVTCGGLRSGSVPSLAGVVLGDNNEDLVRRHARPLPTASAWQRWAQGLIERHGVDAFGIGALRDLQPLCLEMDLPVYEIGSRQCCEAEVLSWIRERSSIKVYGDSLDYEDEDYVPRMIFHDNLEVEQDILFLPPNEEDLAMSLGLPRESYWKRLREILNAVWPEVDEDDEMMCVARVDGVEIIREVTIFTANVVGE